MRILMLLRNWFAEGGRSLTVAARNSASSPPVWSRAGAAFALLASLAFPAFAEWPQFRGNPSLTGIATGTLPPENLKLLWTWEGGESFESSPVIAGGVAYIGAGNGDLVAIDMATGKTKWKYKTGAELGESTPAVGGGAVFIGDLRGGFHAVDAATGRVLWTFKTLSEIKSSPVVVGDRVLVGSYDQNLYAIEIKTGKQLWKFETAGPVHGTPGIANGVAFVTGCDEHFRAIRVSDGKEMFQVSSGAYTGASPLLVGSMAYFGTFGNEVFGVDMAAKKIVWKYEHPVRKFPFYSSATLAAGKIILGGRDKMVHAIDAKTGKGAWTFATRSRVESSPAVAGNRVFIGSNDGRLYVLDAATGKKLWEYEAGSALSASPAISDGRVVIASQDGRVFCFGG